MTEWCGVCPFLLDFETLNTSNASSEPSDQSPQRMREEYSLCSVSAHTDSGASCPVEVSGQSVLMVDTCR